MTIVSNDPSWWPMINANVFYSYWTVAAGVVVVYDWVLTLGQEIELIWRQRWSLMTALYLTIRYIGIPYSVLNVLPNIQLSLTDVGCSILICTTLGTDVVVTAMLDVIMITRLHAMYQRSRMMLIFLVIIFLTVNLACGVMAAIILKHVVGEELILSGMYMCNVVLSEGYLQVLAFMFWMLNAAWEVLALCLAVWIAVKYFRDLRRLGPSTGSAIEDCFRVLIKSHVLYFASFVCVSCLQLIYIILELVNSNSIGTMILMGALQILWGVQLFVLGPRLILSVRESHTNLVAGSDAETNMTSIVFQEPVHVQTSSTV